MLRRAFFFFFWNLYDWLGGWLLLGAMSFVLSLPLVTAPAAWGALLAAAARVQRESEITPALYWHDFKRLAWRSTGLGLILGLGLALCAINIGFYLFAAPVAGWPPVARFVLAGLFFWLALFGAVGLQLAWAFLALQDLPLGKALKRGYRVLGAHPFAALAMALLGGVASLPLLVSVVGAVLMLGAVWANLFMAIAGGVIEHYEALEDQRERDRLAREGARTWTQQRVLDERESARLRRHDRGWSDIFKPWQLR